MRRRLLLSLLLALPLFGQNLRPLTILHTNDLHARLIPDDHGLGGFARLATAVEQEKAGCSSCLYLNAGDLVQGTPVSTIYRGLPIYEIANLLHIDAATVGNHEFDYGAARVQEFAKTANYPLLLANVVDAKGALLTGHAYTIKTAGGIRVAIIGVVLGDLSGVYVTPQQVSPWRVLPVVETVRKYALQLRASSDLIVVLGHIHDRPEVDDILHQVPEVSVVVAGHNHLSYPEMMNVDGRVGVLLDGYGKQLGRLDVQVDVAAKTIRSAQWKKIPIDSKIQPSAVVEAQVSSWEAKVSKQVDVPIGYADRRLAGAELRGLIERAMAEQTGADIAFINSGNTRDTLPQGTILARAIWNILPFDNTVVMGSFLGSELPEPVRKEHTVDPNRRYTLAVTDFTAANQAAANELQSHGLQFPKKTGMLQRDMVIDWIRKKKRVP